MGQFAEFMAHLLGALSAISKAAALASELASAAHAVVSQVAPAAPSPTPSAEIQQPLDVTRLDSAATTLHAAGQEQSAG